MINDKKQKEPHNICCRHEPGLEPGSTIINNCAGCDRRFRSLYKDINTISYWEVIDSIPDLPLPDHRELKVSIHDSCGYRHKPQVHKAIRSLLAKMHIKMRAEQFPCDDIVVYCIGCVRAIISGGKIPRYLPDLLLNRVGEPMLDTLDEYHSKLAEYIQKH